MVDEIVKPYPCLDASPLKTMLLQLEIQHLATFEKVRCPFDDGLNIISGMSGAGKSVLLKALDLCLGGRFSQKLIAEGSEKAEVKALFALPQNLIELYRDDLEIGEEGEILIRRTFKREGRTTNQINDSLVSADLLKRLGIDLARTLSQDEALGLKDPSRQLLLLDNHGGVDLSTYQTHYNRFREMDAELKKLKEEAQRGSDQREFLSFQLAELEKLSLEEGELAELEQKVQVQSRSADIEGATSSIQEAGRHFLGEVPAAIEQLKDSLGDHPDWSPLLEEGEEISSHAEAWLSALRDLGSDLEFDPSDLSRMEERLVQLRQASKRFGRDESELIQWRDELKKELNGPPPEISIAKLEKEREECLKQLTKEGSKLHKARIKASNKLATEVNIGLESLEMAGERFGVELQELPEPQPTGLSELHFTLRPTADHAPQPLHETASGGERSRALLCICAALRGALGTPLLVFDEIDTNIGSRLGRPIAESFLRLAEKAQVLCVTHLAPVAASGQTHLLIEKGSKHSSLRPLKEEERVEEIAHMTAGERNSSSALEQAQSMFKQYQSLKV